VEPDKVHYTDGKEYCEEPYTTTKRRTFRLTYWKKNYITVEGRGQACHVKTANEKPYTGPYDIAVELLKFGGEMALNKLHEICTKV